MEYIKFGEDGFWDRWPEQLDHFHAQQGAANTGTKIGYFLMGDASENPPTVLALEMKPGEIQARHSHPCHRFEIVAKGTLTTESGRVLEPGDVMISEPHQPYGPSQAGPDGCVTFEIFSFFSGSYRGSLVFDDGDEVGFDANVPGRTPADIARERRAAGK